jgi:hypothetical protein
MTLRTATRDQGAGITAPRSRAWAIGSGADAAPTLPGETDEGTPMTNIICVLYNDPVSGYPPS